jgi:hypothetical protein
VPLLVASSLSLIVPSTGKSTSIAAPPTKPPPAVFVSSAFGLMDSAEYADEFFRLPTNVEAGGDDGGIVGDEGSVWER